jgi:superfamily II DNA/RNA helicase
LLLTPLRQSTHNLVYCGDGTVEVPSEKSVERQINAVTRLLGAGLGMSVSKYTAETPLSRRDVLRSQFASGEVQCLVAIRCLDEGVDIPETQRAFILASSSNPRQFIQRRGRLLRTSPNKEIAEVFDFVVEPPPELSMPGTPYYSVTRRLVGKELLRVIEFAKLAVNGPEALHQLLDLRSRLNLLDLGIEEYDI